MISQQQILENIATIFGNGDEAFAAKCILNYVNSNSPKHINLEFVRQLCIGFGNRRLNDASIVRALQYLAGDSAKTLEICFEIEIDDDEFADLTIEQAKEAIANSIDPISGCHDDTLLNRILVFYRPTSEFLSSRSYSA